MPLNDFESLLKQSIGLDATALGRTVIERAVRERAAACALPDWNDYLEHLLTAEEELQSLVETVVAPENWFFRDRVTFETLGRLAVQCWLTASHGEQLRLLSVGCGSGEEPYSMAMELLDCGFPAERLRIDSVDISGQVIARARQGIYGRTSFRGADLRFRERYFKTVPEGFKLDAPVRQTVTFFRANVLSESFLAGRGDYDFILCRNLLAYFDATTQSRVVQTLCKSLARNGVIFVAPAEAFLLTKPDFVPVEIRDANAFLKAGKRKVRVATQTARHLRTQLMTPPPSKPGAAAAVRSALDLASRLAERGQWADVSRLCEAHVREHGESAQALYLLGRVRDAKGELEPARQLYQRALGINSEHTFASLRLAQLPDRDEREITGNKPAADIGSAKRP
ncbi:MAG: chemotaxis protein methyltransferase WspC [Verrucomicrobiota bacterium]|jgi:chemotaxis protein methyltransferase WspC